MCVVDGRFVPNEATNTEDSGLAATAAAGVAFPDN